MCLNTGLAFGDLNYYHTIYPKFIVIIILPYSFLLLVLFIRKVVITKDNENIKNNFKDFAIFIFHSLAIITFLKDL